MILNRAAHMDELWWTFILSKPRYTFYYANWLNPNYSMEKCRLLETALWLLSSFVPCFFFFQMWGIRFRFSGCCFYIFRFVFISLTTAQIVRFNAGKERERKKLQKIIIFIIKSVSLHERAIKWPINFSRFLSAIFFYFANAFSRVWKIFSGLSIGKWKIYGRD